MLRNSGCARAWRSADARHQIAGRGEPDRLARRGDRVVASWVISLLERAIPLLPNFALSIDLFIDWRVIAFSIGLALVTGLASGLGPALAATRVELAATQSRSFAGRTPRQVDLRGRAGRPVRPPRRMRAAAHALHSTCHSNRPRIPGRRGRGHRAEPSIGGIRHRARTSSRTPHGADSPPAWRRRRRPGSCR